MTIPVRLVLFMDALLKNPNGPSAEVIEECVAFAKENEMVRIFVSYDARRLAKKLNG